MRSGDSAPNEGKRTTCCAVPGTHCPKRLSELEKMFTMATRSIAYSIFVRRSVEMFTMTTSEMVMENNYHHGDLKNALIAAGLALLASEGVDRLTLRAVARRAGVSHTAPYRHFANKEALLAAIAEDGFAQLAATLDAALGVGDQATVIAATRSATGRVVAGGLAYVQFAQQNPAIFRLMFSPMVGDRSHYPTLYLAAKRAFNLLLAAIVAGQGQDEFVAGPADVLTMSLWAMVHGLATLVIDNQIPVAPVTGDQAEAQCTLTTLLHHMLIGLKDHHHHD